jgi:hypothetical protein
MNLSPLTVWEWYSKRPRWAKWLLFVFVLVVIAVVAVWWFLGKTISGGDIVQAAKDHLDTNATTDFERTATDDRRLETEIKTETTRREKNKKAREERQNEANSIHDQIDGADTIDELAKLPTFDDGRR